MSKEEATRLADEAGNEIGKADPQWEVIDAAIEMLRRWPDGEPVATLHDDGCFTWQRDEFRLKYDRQRAGWRMDVYAAPPDQSERIAALEAALEQARVALGVCKGWVDIYGQPESQQQVTGALRAIEEVKQ